ncbi:quinone oxidoreductase family protein [Natrialbaceae archaeon A-gly3]
MRAVRYHEHGGPDVLRVEDVSRPEPGAEELLVAVEAATVNPVDTYFREGSYPPGELPWVPGSDVAGVVEEAGEETDLEVGDRVIATALGNDHQGTCAEYAVVPEEFAAPLPESVGFETAAAGALVGVTAWQSLIAACGLEPGQRVLIHGGNGGVGHIAVQLAATTGADVTTTASPDYHDRLEALGAETVLDYARDDLEDAILEAGEPDAILDHRLDDYLGLDCRVAGFNANVAAIGNTDSKATFPNVPAARGKALTVHHVSMFNTPDIGGVLERLVRLYERGDIEPVVDRTYALEGVADAQTAVLEESVFGKLVVVP